MRQLGESLVANPGPPPVGPYKTDHIKPRISGLSIVAYTLWSTIGAGAFGAISDIVSIAALWFVGC